MPESPELPPPPDPIRPDDMDDESWADVVRGRQRANPSLWRTEDGTIYSRRTPSWMALQAPGVLTDSELVLTPGDEHYDWFAEEISPLYDYYRAGDEEPQPAPEPEIS